MKHLLRIGLALTLALSAYGCGGGEEEDTADAGTKVDAGKKDSGTTCPTEMCNCQCCPTSTHCDMTLMMCVSDTCTPNCTNKYCGDPDGCGGKCTACPAGQSCDASTWQCKASTCTPQCSGKSCGAADGCGGKCAGSCPTGQTCNTATYTCQTGSCTPQCSGKACGDADGCGAKCFGTCPSGQTCNSATYTCQTAGSCDPSTCAQGQGCYDPTTGSASGTTVCTCLPATDTTSDTCAAYGLVCDMDPDSPAPATCRLPEQWEDCNPNAAGSCAPGHTCMGMQDGSGVCAKNCAGGSPDCDDIMTACFQTQAGNICWYNICADPTDTQSTPTAERANYFQSCDTGDTVPGTCIPLNLDDGAGGCSDLGICLQSGSAASGGSCDPDAYRTNMAGLCWVNHLCFGYQDGSTKCLGLCNSGPNPQPVATCSGGLTCYDASGLEGTNYCPQARLGACDVAE